MHENLDEDTEYLWVIMKEDINKSLHLLLDYQK
jgi:hypothetical protein